MGWLVFVAYRSSFFCFNSPVFSWPCWMIERKRFHIIDVSFGWGGKGSDTLLDGEKEALLGGVKGKVLRTKQF